MAPPGLALGLAAYLHWVRTHPAGDPDLKPEGDMNAVMDGKALTPAEVQALATLPSREVIFSQLLGVLNAPATQLVRLLGPTPTKWRCPIAGACTP